MPFTLLQIGNTDLTDYIDIQNYEVNKEPVYEEWTDGNHVKHRNKIRTRISGSFKVGFKTAAEATAFITLLTNSITSGSYYTASIYTNDDDTLNTADIYLDGTAIIKRDLLNGRVWHEYSLEVEER